MWSQYGVLVESTDGKHAWSQYGVLVGSGDGKHACGHSLAYLLRAVMASMHGHSVAYLLRAAIASKHLVWSQCCVLAESGDGEHAWRNILIVKPAANLRNPLRAKHNDINA